VRFVAQLQFRGSHDPSRDLRRRDPDTRLRHSGSDLCRRAERPRP
jgi:hypothetical protein